MSDKVPDKVPDNLLSAVDNGLMFVVTGADIGWSKEAIRVGTTF
jgi:hypothetical protein